MKENQRKANIRKIISSILVCLALLGITLLVSYKLPTLVIRVADIVKVSFIISIVVMVIKTIPTIKEMWKDYCDETDRETMKALLGVTMACEYGIDIHDQRYLKHGDPLKILLNDVNWNKKFKQYKYQFGVAPKSDQAGVDTYALMHQLT
jgi:cation transport ATPase